MPCCGRGRKEGGQRRVPVVTCLVRGPRGDILSLSTLFPPSAFLSLLSSVESRGVSPPAPWQVSPLPIFVGEKRVTPAWEEAWLSSEPEHHQNNKEDSDGDFCKAHGAQQLVLGLDDLEGCLLSLFLPFPKAKVLPEAAGRSGGGQCVKGLYQAWGKTLRSWLYSSRKESKTQRDIMAWYLPMPPPQQGLT